jgi:hypothetical protein
MVLLVVLVFVSLDMCFIAGLTVQTLQVSTHFVIVVLLFK